MVHVSYQVVPIACASGRGIATWSHTATYRNPASSAACASVVSSATPASASHFSAYSVLCDLHGQLNAVGEFTRRDDRHFGAAFPVRLVYSMSAMLRRSSAVGIPQNSNVKRCAVTLASIATNTPAVAMRFWLDGPAAPGAFGVGDHVGHRERQVVEQAAADALEAQVALGHEQIDDTQNRAVTFPELEERVDELATRRRSHPCPSTTAPRTISPSGAVSRLVASARAKIADSMSGKYW